MKPTPPFDPRTNDRRRLRERCVELGTALRVALAEKQQLEAQARLWHLQLSQAGIEPAIVHATFRI